eukprot:gnl/MRDRNA2_/MRDRNA2_102071_c0_seq1.p1 gnl/MRDRNA2_/MRDRNA2_102071_c0~~gnl/MRDRNA2_/MRDRNA2_102071_c0_seq1.p1  ORF type:complete len:420 (+),score=63.68 gnl/MRDRNA2_/MRDRNA2_102071_c0_seq1:103-1362(+)
MPTMSIIFITLCLSCQSIRINREPADDASMGLFQQQMNAKIEAGGFQHVNAKGGMFEFFSSQSHIFLDDSLGKLTCAPNTTYVANLNKSERFEKACRGDRLMPSLFLIGTNKGGSTSVFDHLWESVPALISGAPWGAAGDTTKGKTASLDDPARGKSTGKEAGVDFWHYKEKFFWSRWYNKGLDSYLSLYPTCTELDNPEQQYIGFDGTAELLFWSDAPRRIHEAFQELRTPGVRPTFLVLLRDPVVTFHSLLYMHMEQQNKAMNSANWKEQVQTMLSQAKDNMRRGQSCDKKVISYFQPCVPDLAHAAHASMLRNWLQYFEPDQFLLVSSDDYFAAPEKTLVDIMQKLNLPGCVKHDNSAHHENYRNHPSLSEEDPELVQQLRDFYKPYLQDFYGMLSERRFQTIGNLSSQVKNWLDK